MIPRPLTLLKPDGIQRRPEHGFTLIELMIVVAIVGILAAVAMPNYTAYVQKTRRADAASIMLQVQQFMQRYYSANNTYVNATIPINLTTAGSSGQTTYNITLVNLTASSYTIQAAPTGVMAGDPCGTYSLQSTGQRAITGSWTLSKCWP
jgi:type IV pilus assembly protein PilE